jgi:SAM-dependent methyltransferase
MEGVEPSKESVDYATILLGGNFVHAGTLQDFPALGEFDVVTLIDALGFSSTPWSDIERIRTLLKPGGLLFIRCSNSFLHAFLFKISIRLMMDSFVSELVVFHKYPLTPRFILRLLRDYGFSNVNIRNAKPSGGGLPLRFLKSAISIIANSLYYLSRRRIIIGPSLEVMERKP